MRYRHLVISLVLILCSLFIVFSWIIFKQTTKDSTKPLVVCTTTIIGDTIKNIARDTIDLTILMGPGVDPHLYKPIEQDVLHISNAHIIFYNGLHLEARMTDLFEHLSSTKNTVAVTRDIPRDQLIQSPHLAQFVDPHVWFDPLLWIQVIETITKTLQDFLPQHEDLYETNKQTFIAKIRRTHETLIKQNFEVPQSRRILITGHDAFSYFARMYDYQVVSLQGISTISEAGTQDVQNIINVIIQNKIPTIFAESSIPTRNIQALQEGAKSRGYMVSIGEELLSDALGSPETAQGTYLGMLTWNTDSIVSGLKEICH
jgi:manganese/zinc/iron transport system substrate-binding protein